jgi:hypothetical protein
VDINSPVQYQQYGYVQVGEQPEQAGLAHVHGPLTIRLIEQRADQLPLCFVAGGKGKYVQAVITTFLPDRRSWIAVYSQGRERGDSAFPPGVVPLADVEFPPRVPGELSVRRQFALGEFC